MACVRESPTAAWMMYGAIGTVATLGLVLIACDGAAKANDGGVKASGGKASGGKASGGKVKPPVTAAEVAELAANAAAMDAAKGSSVHDDLGKAFEEVLRDKPRVLGVGELHLRTDKVGPAHSALATFTAQVMPTLGPQMSDLVIETWVVDPACKTGGEATKRVESAMKRPESTKNEIGGLIGIIKQNGIKAHVMRLTCEDLAAVAPASASASASASGEIDAEKLLGLVTRELGRVARSAVRYREDHAEPRPLIVVYGGALHNDLYPYKTTKQWSYAESVDEATGGRYVEVDLYLPELIEGQALYEGEAWYPLVAKTPPGKVLLVERAPHSWVAVLPRS